MLNTIKTSSLLVEGDSIANGFDGIENTAGWRQQVATTLNIKFDNLAVNGTVWRNRATGSLYQRTLVTNYKNYQYMLILCGTNDFHDTETPLGKDDSKNVNDFYGAVRESLQNIYRSNKDLRIALILPIYRGEGDAVKNGLGLRLCDYCEALVNVANDFNIPYLNLNNRDGINKLNYANYLSNDRLHPNSTGYALLGKRITEFVSIEFGLKIA